MKRNVRMRPKKTDQENRPRKQTKKTDQEDRHKKTKNLRGKKKSKSIKGKKEIEVKGNYRVFNWCLLDTVWLQRIITT